MKTQGTKGPGTKGVDRVMAVMTRVKGWAALALLSAGALGWPLLLSAQAASRSIVKAADVEYLFPEQVTVAAGRASKLALHFRVAQGLHINSHTPREQFLIPTAFSVPDSSDVKVEAINYPEGSDLTLPINPGEKLSVYTGEFVIDTRIVATRGNHLVEGKLHYQACNNTTCLPPRTITVPIDVVGN